MFTVMDYTSQACFAGSTDRGEWKAAAAVQTINDEHLKRSETLI